MSIKPHYTIIRSCFGGTYQLITNGFDKPQSTAERISFFCPVLTQTFLSQLTISTQQWRTIAMTAGAERYQLTNPALMEGIAERVVRGDIAIYEFPCLEKKAVIDKKGNAYSFIAGPEHYPGTDLNPKFILNKVEAQKLIANIKAKESYWCDILREQELLKLEIKPNKMSLNNWHDVVSELIISGKLLVYQTKDVSRTPKPKDEIIEDTSDMVGNVKVPLAPPTVGPAREIDSSKVKTNQEEACAELDKCEVDDAEAAEKAGMIPDDLAAIKETCEDNNASISFRDTNKACLPHMREGIPSKGSDVSTKTFKAECLPPDKKHLAGLVSNMDKMPTDGSILSGEDLNPYKTREGTYLTGDYDMHDMVDAKTGKRIVGESPRDQNLRKKMNENIGEPDRIKHGAQANYMDYCKKKKIDPNTALLQPDPPVTMVDGKEPVTLYRIENDEQLLNMYNCKGTEIPESWNFERKQVT